MLGAGFIGWGGGIDFLKAYLAPLQKMKDLSPGQTADCFAAWNKGAASSYLLEITANILRTKDLSGDGFMVDAILDTAQGKGTVCGPARAP